MARTWALLLPAALCLAPPAWADAQIELFHRITPSLLKVEAHNDDGSTSLGTAVVVGRGMVVTNCHVTRRASAIELVRGALRRRVESQHSDIEHDLCLLHAPQAEDDPVAAINPVAPRVGQAVYAVGFILGIAPRLSAGAVDALYDYDGGKVLRTTTPFTSGASGGGLFDPEGRLVGIVTFRSRGGGSQHFCLPVQWVEEALTRYDGRPVAPLTGSTFWQREREDQPYFLRAAALEEEQNWTALAEVARQWAFAEAGNASSWYLLGQAHARLRQGPQSIDAYKAAVAIEADFAQAWLQLGLAYARAGQERELRRVERVLRAIDDRLAQDLAQRAPACAVPDTIDC